MSNYSLGAFLPGSTSPAFNRGTLPGTVTDSQVHPRQLRNSNRVADVWTVTISTVTDSTDYTLYIDGIEMKITSDASAVNTEIRDALINYINGSILSGRVVAASTGATTFTITCRQPGELVDVVEYDSRLTLAHTTTASNNSSLPAGVFVSRTSDGKGCALPSIVAAVAQVTTLTFNTAVNSATYFSNVTMLSGAYSGRTYMGLYVADASATMQEIVEGLAADLNGKLPADTVVVTEDDAVLTCTSEVAGVAFAVDGNCTTSSVTATVATSTANVVSTFTYPLVGAVRSPVMKAGAQVLPDEIADVIDQAKEMFLAAEDAPSSLTGTIYVRGTAGSLASQTPGKIRFADSDSGKCLAVSGLSLNHLTAQAGSGTYSFRLNNPVGPS